MDDSGGQGFGGVFAGDVSVEERTACGIHLVVGAGGEGRGGDFVGGGSCEKGVSGAVEAVMVDNCRGRKHQKKRAAQREQWLLNQGR